MYNQNIQANLEDDEEDEFVMRTLAQQYDNVYSDDEPKQRVIVVKGGGQTKSV